MISDQLIAQRFNAGNTVIAQFELPTGRTKRFAAGANVIRHALWGLTAILSSLRDSIVFYPS